MRCGGEVKQVQSDPGTKAPSPNSMMERTS